MAKKTKRPWKPELAEHTPGPWRTAGDQIETIAKRINDIPEKSIAVVAWGCSCCKTDADETDLANARLISASPELLAAAKLALVSLKTVTLRTEISAMLNAMPRQVLEAAIAKAEGRNP